FLPAAFSFEPAHLSRGSVAAVARCGTASKPHSSNGNTSIFIMSAPFVSSGVSSSVSHVRDELVLAIDLRDRADLHLLGGISGPIIDREHELFVRGVVPVSLDSAAILHGCHLELLSSEVVEQVCLDVDALAVQDAPEVVPRRLVVRRPRLPLV